MFSIKILIKVIALLIGVIFLIYTIYHVAKEHKIKSLVNGTSYRKVVTILGDPIQRSKGSYDVLSHKEFKSYSSDKNELAKNTHKSCSEIIIKLYFKGHKCLFFCPSSFEDNIIVFLNENEEICEIKRYGL